MIKEFHIQIPLNFKESFTLLQQSGGQISGWGKNNVDSKHGYIEWKQSFWLLTGSTLISAQLKSKGENQTSVDVLVHKPMQVVDPFGICSKVFGKLDRSVRKNLANR
jgi:hypothetical protein